MSAPTTDAQTHAAGRSRGRGRRRRKRHDADTIQQGAAPSKAAPAVQTAPSPLVDIGINVTSAMLKGHWRELVGRAGEAGVAHILLTGTSLKCSAESIAIARSWHAATEPIHSPAAAGSTKADTSGKPSRPVDGVGISPTLRCTVGVRKTTPVCATGGSTSGVCCWHALDDVPMLLDADWCLRSDA